MDEKTAKPSWIRIAAAVILGAIVGFIIFLIVALVIGSLNDLMGMSIPINLRIAENIWSPILLIIFIGLSIAGLWWKVETTPPTEPEIVLEDIPNE
jgi:tetrahydromethanopterin S-methyltransferase subunit C